LINDQIKKRKIKSQEKKKLEWTELIKKKIEENEDEEFESSENNSPLKKL